MRTGKRTDCAYRLCIWCLLFFFWLVLSFLHLISFGLVFSTHDQVPRGPGNTEREPRICQQRFPTYYHTLLPLVRTRQWHRRIITPRCLLFPIICFLIVYSRPRAPRPVGRPLLGGRAGLDSGIDKRYPASLALVRLNV
ncbi:uncharacterized protein LY79DRAFT_174967 [Colletotrichum navitas]|uniref:Uncharacterized protein n=1 Tax=Colletotrichum navitas TaxID=681940 RepID=A0AAD8Q1J3_9PEZI|nr:uncharacterized protein LY79DRAFT_174967 [Colletotrichum navitas]KAK1593621.1 hypothetical protein LY79DRAFT_174967 [Colletotrichum navitas]